MNKNKKKKGAGKNLKQIQHLLIGLKKRCWKNRISSEGTEESRNNLAKSSRIKTQSLNLFRCVLFFSIIVGSVFVFGIGKVSAADSIVYVSPSGSNTSPYDTWAKAALLPSTAQTYLDGQTPVSGHQMYIQEGNYTDSLVIITSTKDNNEAVYGVSPSGITASCTGTTCRNYPAVKENLIITPPAGYHAIRIETVSGVSVNNLSATGADATHSILNCPNSTVTFNNIYAHDAGLNTVVATGTSIITINKSVIGGSYGGAYNASIIAGNSGTLTINDSIIKDGVIYPSDSTMRFGFYATGTGTINLNNDTITLSPVFINSTWSSTFYTNLATASILVRNSIIYASGSSFAKNSAGTINFYNSLIVPTVDYAVHYYGTVGLDNTNITTVSPKVTNYGKIGYVVPCVDDSDYAYVQSLESTFAKYGVKGTFYLIANALNLRVPSSILYLCPQIAAF